MTAQKKAEETIQKVLDRMTTAEVDQLAPDSGEFKVIASAIMAWYQLLYASGVIKRSAAANQVMSASLVVLGTLVKYSYALGRRRGQRDCQYKSAGKTDGPATVGASGGRATPTTPTAADRGLGHA